MIKKRGINNIKMRSSSSSLSMTGLEYAVYKEDWGIVAIFIISGAHTIQYIHRTN